MARRRFGSLVQVLGYYVDFLARCDLPLVVTVKHGPVIERQARVRDTAAGRRPRHAHGSENDYLYY